MHILFLFFILSYFLGAIPFGLLFAKFFQKKDLRTLGSGNIGATNVLRTGSKTLAVATLFCDAAKGFLPVYMGLYFLKAPYCFVIGMLTILGHIFPIWLKFKGGKGVATALGVLLALSPPTCFIVIGIWIVVAKVFRMSSLAALVAISISPLPAYLFRSGRFSIFCGLIAILLCWTHRDNIRRLVQGHEHKF